VILLADLDTPSSSRRSADGKAGFRKNRKAAYRPATAGVKAKSLVPLEDPYGRVTKISGSTDSDFQYAGYYEHATSGLNLTWFRAYDPTSARWLSRDPLKNAERSQGLNLYEYVKNNPIIWIDSLGLDIWIGSLGPHENINVGQQGGSNNFSETFGVDFSNAFSWQNGLQGTVYQDFRNTTPNSGQCIHTTPAQDALAIQELESLEGDTAPYRLLNSTCRDFSQAAFQFFQNQFK
jgi:RHS repeat-associated protein